MMRSRRLLALAASAILTVFGTPVTSASAQGQTWFQVQLTQGIEGYDWSPGGTVDVSWNAPTATTIHVQVDGFGHWFWQPEDLAEVPTAGSHVQVTDGTTTRDLDVSPLWVTLADPVTDVVAGIATTGDQVQVNVYSPDPGPGDQLDPVVAGPDGHWSLDLSALSTPIDLVAWQGGGSAEVRDADGDATSFGWATPTPFIRAMTWGGGSVYGHGWLPQSRVTVNIDKPGTDNDLTNELTADYQGTITWELDWGYGLAPGDVVTATSEDGLVSRQVVVTDFAIDTVTLPHTVIGHAPAGTSVHAYVGDTEAIVTANAQGVWTFTTTADLVQQGDNISATMYDLDGDWVEAAFYVRDHEEIGPPGPSNGQTYTQVGQSVTYGTDLWVAYPAAPNTFTVTWNWGDGTTSSGSVVFNQGDPQVATVEGSHAYRRVGTYPISVTVSQPGISAATSGPSDGSVAMVYDPKRPVSVSGTGTVMADNHSGGYYDVGFAGGPVNLTITAGRTAKTGALTGSVVIAVPDMNGGQGMTFTATAAGFEALFADPANRLGNEALLFVHGVVTHVGGNPDTAAGGLIHIIDRAKGPDLLRIVLHDEGGMGYPILDTVAFDDPGGDPGWTNPPAWQISVANDQTTASVLRVK